MLVLLIVSMFLGVVLNLNFYLDLTTTSHFLSNFSIILLLIPNTPYSDSPNASYVEQAMTGMLLGDGVLVKIQRWRYIF